MLHRENRATHGLHLPSCLCGAPPSHVWLGRKSPIRRRSTTSVPAPIHAHLPMGLQPADALYSSPSLPSIFKLPHSTGSYLSIFNLSAPPPSWRNPPYPTPLLLFAAKGITELCKHSAFHLLSSLLQSGFRPYCWLPLLEPPKTFRSQNPMVSFQSFLNWHQFSYWPTWPLTVPPNILLVTSMTQSTILLSPRWLFHFRLKSQQLVPHPLLSLL